VEPAADANHCGLRRAIERVLARRQNIDRLERLLRITLPSSVPYIATGLRISSTVSLILAFTAELFLGIPGLGQKVNFAQSYGLSL